MARSGKQTVRDDLSLLLGMTFLIGGAILLYDCVSEADQSSGIMGGAVLLSLGSVVLGIALKNWWEGRGGA